MLNVQKEMLARNSKQINELGDFVNYLAGQVIFPSRKNLSTMMENSRYSQCEITFVQDLRFLSEISRKYLQELADAYYNALKQEQNSIIAEWNTRYAKEVAEEVVKLGSNRRLTHAAMDSIMERLIRPDLQIERWMRYSDHFLVDEFASLLIERATISRWGSREIETLKYSLRL